MNTNQFTQKTMEALQRAQQIAVEYQHMQVDEEHMLLSLTEDAKALHSAAADPVRHQRGCFPCGAE